MESLQDTFKTAKKKARYLQQYLCCGKKAKPFWGGPNATCRRCKRHPEPLLPEERIGVGWFSCRDCSNLFASFIRGCDSAPCNRCKRQLSPMFIAPGDRADRQDKKKSKNRHNCSACHGSGRCPTVEMITGNNGIGIG
jgi:hypothetical protein